MVIIIIIIIIISILIKALYALISETYVIKTQDGMSVNLPKWIILLYFIFTIILTST
jgi:hypothetical protein